jgi:hypothetical protein
MEKIHAWKRILLQIKTKGETKMLDNVIENIIINSLQEVEQLLKYKNADAIGDEIDVEHNSCN